MTYQNDRRRVWEERWQQRDAEEFGWYLSEPPSQLVELVESGRIPAGAALDVACGNGVATRYLARSFVPAVGIDIALAAVAQSRAGETGPTLARFLVADATATFPFKDRSFGFVFDRGGVQNLPVDVWPRYFHEVARVLRPGGFFQLLSSRPDGGGAARESRPLRSKVAALVRRKRGAEPPHHARLRRLAHPAFDVLTLEDFSFRTQGGKARRFTHALLRRAPDPAG